jgi:hypothetical protein
MKLFAITILLFVSLFGLTNTTKTEKKIFTKFQYEFSDSDSCSKTFTFELKGNVTKETSAKAIDYLLNKTGICNAIIDLSTKIISIDVVDSMDYNSIKGLVNYTQHLYLLEGSDPTNNVK